MAWVDENINTYVRDLIRPVLHSTYVSVRPLLAILAGRDKANLDRLGDPDAGAFWGGNNIGIGERNMLSGSLTHKFRYQKSQTDAAAVVTEGAATPTSTVFSEDNVGTAGVNWTHFWNPIKVREDSVLGWSTVLQRPDLARLHRGPAMVRRWSGNLWSSNSGWRRPHCGDRTERQR